MGTGTQIALFVLFSPVWIFGMLLMVVGWRRQALGRGVLAEEDGLVFAPVDNGRSHRRARVSVVVGWLMVVLSIAPLGLFLLSIPRPSIPVFAAVAFWRWHESKQPSPEPIAKASKVPFFRSGVPGAPREAVSGARFALGYAIPVIVAASLATRWSNVDDAGGLHFFLACFAPVVPIIFETSRPHRGAVLAIGEVIAHKKETDTRGRTTYQELVRFSTGSRTIEFGGLSHNTPRPLGAPVNVSYRFGEPDHARAVPDDGSWVGILVAGGVVALLAALSGWTSLIVIGMVGVGHAHFVVVDRRRAAVSGVLSPAPFGTTNDRSEVVR